MTILDDLASQPHPPVEDRLDAPVRELRVQRVGLHFAEVLAGPTNMPPGLHRCRATVRAMNEWPV